MNAITRSYMRAPSGSFLIDPRTLLGPIVVVRGDEGFCEAVGSGSVGVYRGVEVLSLDAPTRTSPITQWREAQSELDLKIDFTAHNGLTSGELVFARPAIPMIIRAACEVFDAVIFSKRRFHEPGEKGKSYVVGVALRQSHYDAIKGNRIGLQVDFYSGVITLYGDFDARLFQMPTRPSRVPTTIPPTLAF